MTSEPAPPLPAVPQAPDKPPMFGFQPTNKKPKQKSMQTTFLGEDTRPQANQLGAKTLLGQ